MVISLAHDIMAYFNDRGSAVYTCSLDAKGAFDAIPRVVVFGKLHGALEQRVPVRRGTRQGGTKQPMDIQRILRGSH